MVYRDLGMSGDHCKPTNSFFLCLHLDPLAMHRFSQTLEQKQDQTEKQLEDALRD